MLNEEFYNHKAAVLMHQKALQDKLAEHGFDTEGKQIHELVPMIDNIKAGAAYDINANIDSLNVELLQLTGKESITADAEEIQDFNNELDIINSELSTIKGE